VVNVGNNGNVPNRSLHHGCSELARAGRKKGAKITSFGGDFPDCRGRSAATI
jgi:hypothetical protein